MNSGEDDRVEEHEGKRRKVRRERACDLCRRKKSERHLPIFGLQVFLVLTATHLQYDVCALGYVYGYG